MVAKCPRPLQIEPNSSRQILEKSCDIGAGEGIRTLDPNLGKVVLYP